MTTKTKVVLLLVVVGLLYLASLGLGLYMHSKDGPTGVGGGGGLGPLNSLRAWFAPALDLRRLRCKGPGLNPSLQLRVNKEFTLDENASKCTIDIPGDNEKYRVAELKVTTNADVYIFAAYEDGNDPRDRNYRDAKFKKAERDENCILNPDDFKNTFHLKITFPSDDDGNWSCWLKQTAKNGQFSIPLTVLDDGGDLSLECVRCNTQAGRTMQLLME